METLTFTSGRLAKVLAATEKQRQLAKERMGQQRGRRTRELTLEEKQHQTTRQMAMVAAGEDLGLPVQDRQTMIDDPLAGPPSVAEAEAAAMEEAHSVMEAVSDVRRQRSGFQEERLKREEEAMAQLDSLLPALKESVAAGRPFPVESEGMFAQLNSDALSDVLVRLQLRCHLHHDLPDMDIVKGLDLPDAVNKQWHSKPDRTITTAPLLDALWRQFEVLTSSFPNPEVRCRLAHVYQVRLQPRILSYCMTRFFGMTFLPDRYGARFGKLTTTRNGVEETIPDEMVPLHKIRVLVLRWRRHQQFNGKVVDMPDLLLHRMSVDLDSGLVHIGGESRDCHGTGVSRSCAAYHFRNTPWAAGRAGDSKVVPSDYICESGLACHRAIERSLVHSKRVQDMPEFPRVYLAFHGQMADNAVVGCPFELEVTEALRKAAFREVDCWFRRGKPNDWLGFQKYPVILADLRRKLKRPGRTWGDIEIQLGPQDSEFVLKKTLSASELHYNGQCLVPLEFFQKYSPQQPAKLAVGTYVRFAPHLRGQDVLGSLYESVNDGKGNITSRPSLHVCQDPFLAAPQVIRLTPGAICGELDDFVYDLASLPPGCGRAFDVASVEE
jgi:hypothetical protein